MAIAHEVILAAVIAALPGTLVAIANFRRTKEVHILVNSQKTEMVSKIDNQALEIASLKAALLERKDLKNDG